ncbi:hypothetical protein DM235_15725 [Escherichia coli]|uniref:Uncharacterized protein n=1 Tax=Escherichia coli TaxID=562 RepID=A0A3T7QTT8_ECOLX|nr:hypothetical protein [Escherichia coli]ECF0480997.1 hypothetical protein [Salmonella enterica subsp. enterica serovar Agona]EFN7198207.1 hypothetical protein [Escherichia coli O2:H1]EGB82820.1 hypothetical protein HMPREF9533_02317 [Escherichia coli MS 60-1]HAJ6415386.1 hypothetical protein [Escherichia coli HVH 54 (4-2723514)]
MLAAVRADQGDAYRRDVVFTGHHGDGAVKTQGCNISFALNTFKYHDEFSCFRRAEARGADAGIKKKMFLLNN